MADTRIRTVSYRRAHWSNHLDFPRNLESYLIEALEECHSTTSRTFSYGDYHIQGIKTLTSEIRTKSGQLIPVLLLQIVKYEPDSQANTVHRPSREIDSSDIETEDPPEEKDWIDGDVFILVCQNHVLTCASNVRDTSAAKFIASLLLSSDNHLGNVIKFDKVGAADKIQLIQREGVKCIELGASLYETTLDWYQSEVKSTILKKLSDAIADCFADDKEMSEIAENENISAKVILNFDSRKKGGEIGLQRMEQLAENLIRDEEDSGYVITTRENKRITLDEIQLKKNVQIQKHGKTVNRVDAWDAMKKYFIELDKDGLLME